MEKVTLNSINATELLRRFRAYGKYMFSQNSNFDALAITTAQGYNLEVDLVKAVNPEFMFTLNQKPIEPMRLINEIDGGVIDKGVFDSFR